MDEFAHKALVTNNFYGVLITTFKQSSAEYVKRFKPVETFTAQIPQKLITH